MTEATSPARLNLPVPIRTNSYLGTNEQTRIFQWVLDQTDSLLPGKWDGLLLGGQTPAYEGWTSIGTGTSAISDKIRVLTTIPTASNIYYYVSNALAINTIGNTVEARIKLVSGGTDNDVCIVLDDGTYTETLIITPTYVYLLNADLKYTMDSTDDYHSYTLILKDAKLELFVDKVLRISTTASVAGTSNRLSFGNIGTTGTTISNWHSIKYVSGTKYQIDLTKVDFELQVDSETTFSSVNLKTYSFNIGTLDEQKDGVVHAFTVAIPPRQELSAYTFYWRVRVNSTSYLSPYTVAESYSLDQNTSDEIFRRVFDALPDDHAYTKDGYSGNIAAIIKGLSSEVDAEDFERIRVVRDTDFSQIRDANISGILGVLVGIDRISFNNIAEYRDVLKNIFSGYSTATVTASEQEVVKMITGKEPNIVEQYTQVGWGIHSPGGDPYYIRQNNYPYLQPIIRLFSAKGKAFTWELHVFNPYNFTYNKQLISDLANKLKPAHTQFGILFYSPEGVVLITPSYYGIDYYGEGYYVDARYAL